MSGIININKTVLDNGLRVVHYENTSCPMVVVDVLYNVGSKDESPDHTGFAHLMEHLMFGGSVNVPDFDGIMQKSGGTNNAWTNCDFTNFYDVMPKENAEIAFYLESDRMLSLSFSEDSLKVQKKVVCEEFKERNLNKPYGDVNEIINKMVFKEHPYQWLTIGKKLEHVQKTTINDVKDFFYSHYAPNNAVLSVVGNISWDEVVRLAKKWFQDIPSRNIAKRDLAPEPDQVRSRKKTVHREVPTSKIYKIYRAPNIYDINGYYTSDFLTDILSYSKSSRLQQHLIMDQMKFESIESFIGSYNDEGLIYIVATPNKNITLEEADKIIMAEIDLLKDNPPTEEEMQKVKNFYEADRLYPTTYKDIAVDLAKSEMIRDVNDYNKRIELHNSISSAEIQKMAKKLLTKNNCSTLYYTAK